MSNALRIKTSARTQSKLQTSNKLNIFNTTPAAESLVRLQQDGKQLAIYSPYFWWGLQKFPWFSPKSF